MSSPQITSFTSSIASKYNITLSPSYTRSLSTHFSGSSLSHDILQKEFLFSNFYQAVDGKSLTELQCRLLRDDSIVSIPIHSQNDIAALDRLTILTTLTLQIDEIQDISAPQMEMMHDANDDLDEEELDEDDEANEDQIRLFRSHLEKGSKGDGGEEGNGGQYRRRMLKMALTNGFYRFYAIEFDSLYSKMPNMPPVGTKILVKNVLVRRGCLMLTSQSLVQVLGGLNEDLIAIEKEKRNALRKK